jgi:hypothetical protein
VSRQQRASAAPDRRHRSRSLHALAALVTAGAWLALAPAVLGHEAPDEGPAAWIMADWMLGVFLVFAGAALAAFVVAYKRGLLFELERAKFHILTVDEPDYYTPDWAKEDDDAER